MEYIDFNVWNTPMSFIKVKRCTYCRRTHERNGDFYCTLEKGRTYYLAPCSVILQQLCPRAQKEVSNGEIRIRKVYNNVP